MTCPRCGSSQTGRRRRRTSLGYRTFSCLDCGKLFSERTRTPFNELQYPTDVVLHAVQWRLRYKLGFRDVAELLLQRGYAVTHETIRHWEFRFAPLLTEQSHRAVKQRYYPMLGFGSFESASRFCAAFNELRQYFRVRRRGEAHVTLAEQRRLFLTRWRSLISELAAA